MSLGSPLLSSGVPVTTLRTVYDAIATEFVSFGLQQSALQDFRRRCSVEGDTATPLRYDAMHPAYPAGAVRLAILPIQFEPDYREQVLAAVQDIRSALPPGTAAYANSPEHWHVTLFHTARLGDARPDPFVPGGDVRASLDGAAAQRPPSEATLAREVAVMKAQAAGFQPFTLQVYRVVMADSGTLLLCCVDLSSQVCVLRGQLKAAFVGAPPAQTSIMHITLLRLTGDAAAFTAEKRRHIQALCDEWTQRLHGHTVIVSQVVHVLEEVFSTVQGERRSVFDLSVELPPELGGLQEDGLPSAAWCNSTAPAVLVETP